MACIGAVNYDPATAGTKSCASLLAMTAIDTTNARINFTVPASGKVFVRLAVSESQGSGTPWWPVVLLGILDGSTVVHRQLPMAGVHGNVGAVGTAMKLECGFVVTGLTPSASLTWDMAYGVEVVVAASVLRYGGPNNTTANDAGGALVFEVWDA